MKCLHNRALIPNLSLIRVDFQLLNSSSKILHILKLLKKPRRRSPVHIRRLNRRDLKMNTLIVLKRGMILNFITINLKKPLKIKSRIFVLILAAVVLNSCGKESSKKEFIARVNDSYFTQDELSAIVDSGYGRNLYRNEIIRNWIDKELLYQEAQNSGILKDKEFQRVENESAKQLAVTFLINKLFDDDEVSIEPSDIKDYYDNNRDNFKLFHKAFLVNLIQFDDEDKAI